jgi:hypothetical protein
MLPLGKLSVYYISVLIVVLRSHSTQSRPQSLRLTGLKALRAVLSVPIHKPLLRRDVPYSTFMRVETFPTIGRGSRESYQ